MLSTTPLPPPPPLARPPPGIPSGSGGVGSVPRRANVFFSYNNKKASDAIPLFEQVRPALL
jgi:hypothetical protein